MTIKDALMICLFILLSSLFACSKSDESIDKKQAKPLEREVETIAVKSLSLERMLNIPAEISAFRDVSIYPKVQGFVKRMLVDRGSVVKKGQLLVEIDAPELDANYREAQAKYEVTKSALIEAQSKIQAAIAQKDEDIAKSEADEANFKRIQQAAQTPGAIAPADIEAAQKTMQGSRAHVRSSEQLILGAKSELDAQKGKARAANQALKSLEEMKGYLRVCAPFDGVIKERNVHEGSLVSSSSQAPMLKIADTSKLRLIVPIPESAISGIKQNEKMQFCVPAFVGKIFTGSISRISHVLDRRTRTMLVELDVNNSKEQLAPGMYAEVSWNMVRPYKTLFVPASSVLSSEDKTFVIKIVEGKALVVPVTRGQPMNDLVEITGNVSEGDQVILHSSDEYKSGQEVKTHPVSSTDRTEEGHAD